MGTTIGNVLISYDINKSYPQVKSDMEKLGYLESFRYENDSKIYLLPNTTLWHPTKSSDQAMADLKNVCRNQSVTLEKAVTVRASEFVGL